MTSLPRLMINFMILKEPILETLKLILKLRATAVMKINLVFVKEVVDLHGYFVVI